MWETLLKTAIAILNGAGLSSDDWSFGGGTALAFRYKHRDSKDIDIFITDAQWLPYLSPRLNPHFEGRTEYEESSNYVKISCDEGVIDFIVSPYLTADYCTVENLCGHWIQVETPVEIVIKKLFYRGHSMKIRDVIDTAVVYAREGQSLLSQACLLRERLDIIKRRWNNIKTLYDKEVGRLLVHDPALIVKAPALFEEFLSRLEASCK